MSTHDLFETLCEMFKMDPDHPMDSVTESFKSQNTIIIELGEQMRARQLMDSGDNIEMQIRFNRLLERMHYSFYITNTYFHYKNTFAETYTENSDKSFFKYIPLIFEDLKPYQKMIIKLFYYFESNNLRKSGRLHLRGNNGFEAQLQDPRMETRQTDHRRDPRTMRAHQRSVELDFADAIQGHGCAAV